MAAIMIATPAVYKARQPQLAPLAEAGRPAQPKFTASVPMGIARKGDAALEPRGGVQTAPPASDVELALAFAPPERVARARPAGFARAEAPASAPFAATVKTLREARVLEGLRLEAGGEAYQLADVEPLAPGAMCRRLDGVSEDCNQRAIARLEIVMRGRAVSCRVLGEANGGAARASCVAGKIDLADDLLKNGLARRPERVAAIQTRG